VGGTLIRNANGAADILLLSIDTVEVQLHFVVPPVVSAFG
jgi:hypothetical protein